MPTGTELLCDKLDELALHLRLKYKVSQQDAEDAAQQVYFKVKDVKDAKWGLLVAAGHQNLIDMWRKTHRLQYNQIHRAQQAGRKVDPHDVITGPDCRSIEEYVRREAHGDFPIALDKPSKALEDVVILREEIRSATTEQLMAAFKPRRCTCCSRLWVLKKDVEVKDCTCDLREETRGSDKFSICQTHETDRYVGAAAITQQEFVWTASAWE